MSNDKSVDIELQELAFNYWLGLRSDEDNGFTSTQILQSFKDGYTQGLKACEAKMLNDVVDWMNGEMADYYKLYEARFWADELKKKFGSHD